MNRNAVTTLMIVLIAAAAQVGGALGAPPAPAPGSNPVSDSATVRKLFERVTPSLVAVQYVWESELGRRELTGAGVVVGDDGLVMTALALFDLRIPDAQMKEFKIIVPSQTSDAEEIDAEFQGRDERSGMAFLKPVKAHQWPKLQFEDVKVNVGDRVYSVGLLPKNAAYKSYLTSGTVSTTLRGELPQVLVVGGGLASIGSPVFNADGKAIGFVNAQPEQQAFLNADFRSSLVAVMNPPIFFTPASDFKPSLADPPVAGQRMKLPWVGIPQQAMAGLNKDVAESMGVKGQPAIELGDIIPDSPAEKAGLKKGMIVLKLNGKPLERADEPEELPGILGRKIRQMKVGDTVTLSVLTGKGEPLKDIAVKLEERPRGANLAKRYYAEDIGLSVREIVFMDTYVRKLASDAKGVVVSMIKPQSSAAAAKLQINDLITEMNGKAVEGLDDFKTRYQAFRQDKPREAIVLVVLREGNTQTIRIEPPQ
jgi:serine protease Do